MIFRAVPVVREDEDGAQERWVKAAGAECLFADRVAPPREIPTLRGCEPAGPLRDAVDAADGTQAFVSSLFVEVRDAADPVG